MFRKNKKLFGLIFLGIITLSFVLAPLPFGGENIAHAADASTTTAACSTSGWDWPAFACVGKHLMGSVFGFIFALFGIVVGVTGMLLDFVMSYTIVNMASKLQSLLQNGGGIYEAWTTLRDLANMLFIFIILYIAIGTILRLDSINTKKLLVHVIIVALLLNFSLFFTKVIVDTSNIIATSFYNGITATAGTDGVSGAFMKPMGLTGFFNPTDAKTVMMGAGSTDSGGMAMIGLFILGIIFFIVVIFIFFAASLMLIARFVIIIFLMILSPLAFIAMALPKDDYWKKWWHSLMTQSLFAPVFLALLWIAKMLTESTLAPINGNYAALATGATSGGLPPISSLGLLMNFMIVIGSILFAMIAAREISGAGASSIMNWGKKMGINALKMPQKMAGGLLTRTAGRAAAGLDKGMEKTEFGQSLLGRAIRSPLGSLGGAKLLGAKSGKQINEIKQKRTDRIAEIRAGKDTDAAEEKAKNDAEKAVLPYKPLVETLEKKLVEESKVIDIDTEQKMQRSENAFNKTVATIKAAQKERVRTEEIKLGTRGGHSGPDKEQYEKNMQDIRQKTEKEAEKKIQEARGQKMERDVRIANKATEDKARTETPLTKIRAQVKKVETDTYNTTKKAEIKKAIEKLENTGLFKTILSFTGTGLVSSGKSRAEAAKLLKANKKSKKSETDKFMENVLAGIKKEEEKKKKEGKEDHGEDKGGGDGGKGKDSGGGGDKGGGAHH